MLKWVKNMKRFFFSPLVCVLLCFALLIESEVMWCDVMQTVIGICLANQWEKAFRHPNDSLFHHNAAAFSAFQITHDYNVLWLITQGVAVYLHCFSFNSLYKPNARSTILLIRNDAQHQPNRWTKCMQTFCPKHYCNHYYYYHYDDFRNPVSISRQRTSSDIPISGRRISIHRFDSNAKYWT